MYTTFTGYTDAFKGTLSEESHFQKLVRTLRKEKKKTKLLKRAAQDMRLAEEKRATEEAVQPKEKSFWSRIGMLSKKLSLVS